MLRMIFGLLLFVLIQIGTACTLSIAQERSFFVTSHDAVSTVFPREESEKRIPESLRHLREVGIVPGVPGIVEDLAEFPLHVKLLTQPSVNKAFRDSHSLKSRPILTEGNAALNEWPITVSFWAKVESAAQFNIFLAHEPKSSPRHWELYTYAGSGEFSLYLPGNTPTEVRGGPNLADGNWHYLCATLTPQQVTLFVDGKTVAQAEYNRPQSKTPDATSLGIGTLAETGLSCHALMDELLISKELTENAWAVPHGPFPFNETTILLAHFDQPEPLQVQGSLFGTENPTKILSSTDANEEFYYPRGGMEPTVKPGEKPAKNVPCLPCTPEVLHDSIKRLGLESVCAEEFREGVLRSWGEQYYDLKNQIEGKIPLPKGTTAQVYDAHTLIAPGETHPIEPVIRRTGALLEYLQTRHRGTDHELLSKIKRDYDRLVERMNPETDYFAACALRRKLVFLNEALNIERIIFLARASYSGSRLTNMSNGDHIGGHFATQNFGFNTIHGGGIFTIEDWKKTQPKITNLIAERKVRSGRLTGKELDYGSFMSPELSFDGKTLYFAHCGATEHRWIWTPDTTWNIFRLDIKGDDVEQLTDGSANDFDPCELPDGRIAFISERRGGFIRCFTKGSRLRVPTYVLHSMKNDGTDVYPLSYYETSEWQPSVDNNGMIIYTRWDYTDREDCLGSNFWTCFPDGRNPRAPHGNYPFPWHTFEDNKHGDFRFGNDPEAPSALPMTEMQLRAIPDSHRYIFTAAPHHGETFGSLCLLDLREKNDYHMSQVRRLTPYTPFPESESPGRSQYRYSAPWPLDEDVYLCNSWEDLVVLDRFGNEELICERELLPIGYDPRLRLSEPIPLRARPRPPVIPVQTTQSEEYRNDETKATIGIMNVRMTDLPLPEDRPIKGLRVFQVFPKPNPWMDIPFIGYEQENTPRTSLGVAPVEEDGSVYFEAPVGKQLLFQLLDAEGRAVHSMRSIAFVHRGEQLVCAGCHEPTTSSGSGTSRETVPIAFRKAPVKLAPECVGEEDYSYVKLKSLLAAEENPETITPLEPVNYYRHVKPIFERKCVACHVEKNVQPQDMSHEAMRPYVYYFSGGFLGGLTNKGIHGGSRTIPNRFGAYASPLGRTLYDDTHREAVNDSDRRQLILWMDANAPRLGAFVDEQAQKRGELVLPLMD